jgi:WD40 repeat protein
MITKSGYQHKTSFKGHEDVVNCFVVAKIPTPTGQDKSKEERECLFTASSDMTIKQWDMETNALICTFPQTPVKKTATAKQSALGQGLELIGNFGGTAKVAKAQQGHEQGVCCLAVSKGFMYSGSFDSLIIKWDLSDKQQKTVFRGHKEAVYRISIQDVWLLSVSRDATVRVWNEASTQCIAVLKGHTGDGFRV